ncbi:MAG: AMP-binding protein [Steroidobacteraceae bacterium]
MNTAQSPQSVPELLARQAQRFGNRPFLYFEEQVFGYEDLRLHMERVGGALQRAGIGVGDKVAIMLDNRPEFIFIWFALARIGAVEVPVNTAHKGDLLAYVIDQADCRLAFVERALLPQLEAVRARMPKLQQVVVLDDAGAAGWDEFMREAPPAGAVAVHDADPAAILFTSGTTGPSKGAVLPQGYPLLLGRMITEQARYTERDRLLNALPLFHGNAQFLSTVPALVSGAQVVLARRFSASAFWDTVRRHGCTEFNYIGGIVSILLKAEPRADDADNPLRVMIGAGAPRDRFEEFERRFGVQLLEGYGMSEIGIPISSLSDHRLPGSCGRPRGEYEVCVVDDDGNPVGPDTPGELLVRPRVRNGMLLEYYRMPERTVEAWRDLWFHTGDYLQYDAQGWYYFVDRKKDAIRRRGENISSFEVERLVLAHPAVLECAAVAVPSELGEDEVLLCAVLRPGAKLDAGALWEHCDAHMARFMVPRYLRFLERLPKTPTERVQKYLLRSAGVTADCVDREAVPAGDALRGRA